MGLMLTFKRWIKRREPKIEVWDTSAISSFLFKLMNRLDNDQNVRIVIPEGVMHELSAGRRNYENCRLAYTYLSDNINGSKKKIVWGVTPDNARSWTIDEQVVYTARLMMKSGYDVSLVTCDNDQAFSAIRHGLAVEKISMLEKIANKEQGAAENYQEWATNFSENKNETSMRDFGGDLNTLEIPCTYRDRKSYINVKSGMEIYESRGIRKIPHQNVVAIDYSDYLVYNSNRYMVEGIGEGKIKFKRCEQ